MIKCPLCDRELKVINSHLRRHGMTTAEFKLQFPDCPMFSEELRIIVSDSCTKNPNVGRKPGFSLTDEQKQKISDAMKGEKNPFFGKKHTEETRARMKENHADFSGDKNPHKIACDTDQAYRARSGAVAAERWKRIKNDPQRYALVTNKISKGVVAAHLDGRCVSIGKGHKNGWLFSEKFNSNLYFRSSYEEKFIKLAEKLNCIAKLRSCDLIIPYIDNCGNTRRYIPDFILNDYIVIEIKPSKLVDYDNNKIKSDTAKLYLAKLNIQYYIITELQLNELDLRTVIECTMKMQQDTTTNATALDSQSQDVN